MNKAVLVLVSIVAGLLSVSSPRQVAQAAGPFALGVYEPQPDASGTAIDNYISEVGGKPAFAWQPTTWQDSFGNFNSLDTRVLDEYRTRGIMPGLTWEPSRGPASKAGPNQPAFAWTEIYSGRYDRFLTQFAQAAATYHYPFLIRTLHEFNGTWYPWCYGVNGNTNIADFVKAWEHIVDIFRSNGATNVTFVWNPAVMSQANWDQNASLMRQAYPGDAYVDWVGLDGYNNDPTNWASLINIYTPSYLFVTGLTTRPLMFFETGSVENPSDSMAKANWITDGFLTGVPTSFPLLRVVVWFDATTDAGKADAVNTSQNSLNAWRKVVASPLYQGTFP